MEINMSNARIPANFNWNFKKSIKMTEEEKNEMLNQAPELNAMINQNNAQQGEEDADGQGNQDAIDEDQNDIFEEFNCNGKLGNNNNGADRDDAGDLL